MPPLTLNQFLPQFEELTDGWSWEVQGILDVDNYVHPIDSDTKVISSVFERLAAPVIRSIARQFNYRVELANQTTYPDFTLTSNDTSHRVALDIKTTYIKAKMGFTLGGYNSFLRDNTKNILYPYDTYHDHWVLGFIYRQLAIHVEYDLESLPKPGEIGCPYSVECVFLREKHEVCGLRAGSGNTKNIGSFKANDPGRFKTELGPFSKFTRAKEACDHYWSNYELYVGQITYEDQLLKHADFQQFI